MPKASAYALRFGLQDMKLREIMTSPVAVHSSMTILQFVNEPVFHYHYRVFPVLELDRFAGMIDVRSLRNLPPQDWPTRKSENVFRIRRHTAFLNPDLNATDALRLLVSRNCGGARRAKRTLIGILARPDLFKLISPKQEMAA
jgi:predicted transcriptional regulator